MNRISILIVAALALALGVFAFNATRTTSLLAQSPASDEEVSEPADTHTLQVEVWESASYSPILDVPVEVLGRKDGAFEVIASAASADKGIATLSFAHQSEGFSPGCFRLRVDGELKPIFSLARGEQPWKMEVEIAKRGWLEIHDTLFPEGFTERRLSYSTFDVPLDDREGLLEREWLALARETQAHQEWNTLDFAAKSRLRFGPIAENQVLVFSIGDEYLPLVVDMWSARSFPAEIRAEASIIATQGDQHRRYTFAGYQFQRAQKLKLQTTRADGSPIATPFEASIFGRDFTIPVGTECMLEGLPHPPFDITLPRTNQSYRVESLEQPLEISVADSPNSDPNLATLVVRVPFIPSGNVAIRYQYLDELYSGTISQRYGDLNGEIRVEGLEPDRWIGLHYAMMWSWSRTEYFSSAQSIDRYLKLSPGETRTLTLEEPENEIRLDADFGSIDLVLLGLGGLSHHFTKAIIDGGRCDTLTSGMPAPSVQRYNNIPPGKHTLRLFIPGASTDLLPDIPFIVEAGEVTPLVVNLRSFGEIVKIKLDDEAKGEPEFILDTSKGRARLFNPAYPFNTNKARDPVFYGVPIGSARFLSQGAQVVEVLSSRDPQECSIQRERPSLSGVLTKANGERVDGAVMFSIAGAGQKRDHEEYGYWTSIEVNNGEYELPASIEVNGKQRYLSSGDCTLIAWTDSWSSGIQSLTLSADTKLDFQLLKARELIIHAHGHTCTLLSPDGTTHTLHGAQRMAIYGGLRVWLPGGKWRVKPRMAGWTKRAYAEAKLAEPSVECLLQLDAQTDNAKSVLAYDLAQECEVTPTLRLIGVTPRIFAFCTLVRSDGLEIPLHDQRAFAQFGGFEIPAYRLRSKLHTPSTLALRIPPGNYTFTCDHFELEPYTCELVVPSRKSGEVTQRVELTPREAFQFE